MIPVSSFSAALKSHLQKIEATAAVKPKIYIDAVKSRLQNILQTGAPDPESLAALLNFLGDSRISDLALLAIEGMLCCCSPKDFAV